MMTNGFVSLASILQYARFNRSAVNATLRMALIAGLLAGIAHAAFAQAFVPGTGRRLQEVGDDFEDPKWTYNLNMPKSSSENDKQERLARRPGRQWPLG